MPLLSHAMKSKLNEYYKSAAAIGKIRLDAGIRDELLIPFWMSKRAPATLALLAPALTQPAMDPLKKIHDSEALLGKRTHPLTLYLIAEESAWKELIESLAILKTVLEGFCEGRIDEEKVEKLQENAQQLIIKLAMKAAALIDELRKIIKVEIAYLPLTDKQIEAHINMLDSADDDILQSAAEKSLRSAGAR